MKRYAALIGGTLAVASSGIALGANAKPLPSNVKPLPNPNGTVVNWNATSKTTVVATADKRVYVIHGLRKSSPGTRVRIQGIKWGKPTKGIKWGKAPSGIKWGIKWARNGTFRASVVRKRGKATTMSLRATVVRRVGKKGIIVSVPGATIGLPAAKRAVWIPRKTKRAKAVGGSLGMTVLVTLRVAPNGTIAMTSAREVAAPAAKPTIPFAGKIVAINPKAHTMRVQIGGNGLTSMITLAIPAGTNLSTLRVGGPVTGTARGTNIDKPLTVTTISSNASFAAADKPIAVPKLPPSTGSDPSPTSPATGETGGTSTGGTQNSSSNSGNANPGGTTGGDNGGNTGGDNGGNTGGDNGGNTGGDTGGNTGGDNGGDNGGNTGGDNGGNTGGDNGGDNGGNNGGDNGGDPGDEIPADVAACLARVDQITQLWTGNRDSRIFSGRDRRSIYYHGRSTLTALAADIEDGRISSARQKIGSLRDDLHDLLRENGDSTTQFQTFLFVIDVYQRVHALDTALARL